jgi:hypothetical protein
MPIQPAGTARMERAVRKFHAALTSGAAIILVVLATGIDAQRGRGRGPQGPPSIDGTWTGTWSAFNPARATTPPQELCARLTAIITQKGDIWQAVFEGDCGRPYKYSIAMEGRLAGGAVMFKGTADLGAQDGGVYDWIGRADNDEFVGFFTSASYTGVFSMARTVK